MFRFIASLAIGIAALSLTSCNNGPKQKSIDALDKELTSGNSADPAVKSALEDQIMVDPQLASKANAHSIRPPDEPYGVLLPTSERHAAKTADPPMTLGEKAASQLKPQTSGCNMAVAYSALWATKLPEDLPIYPQGHVSEAAGSDTPGCHLRIVSFASAASPQTIAEFYTGHGRQAGYAVKETRGTLNGARAKDNAMFSITLTPADDGGTSVDLVSNAGR